MFPCSDRYGRRQRGDILFEALIGVLITAVIGAGLAHVLARVMVAQRDSRVEQFAVDEVRTSLHGQGLALCAQGELPLQIPGGLEGAKASITCEPVAAPVSFGADYTTPALDLPPRMVVSVPAEGLELGGPDLRIETAFGATAPGGGE